MERVAEAALFYCLDVFIVLSQALTKDRNLTTHKVI
ncbi:hypothetical protein ACVIEM_004964 [Rhizobium leguminosarum]